jgi:hypothetical protein
VRDSLSVYIDFARLLVERDRRLLGLSHMTLSDLKSLAQRQRERLERITARAAEMDARGVTIAAKSDAVMSAHESVLDGLEAELKDIEAFNSDMGAQLGNAAPAGRPAVKPPGNGAAASAKGVEQPAIKPGGAAPRTAVFRSGSD